MRDVFIIGVGMTPFDKHLSLSVKDLAAQALQQALYDAGITSQDLQAAWFSNTAWGYFTHQHSIRGQVALRACGISGIPVTNVENACAGGSTALHEAWRGVASGQYECALAIGAEKMCHEDKAKVFRAFWSGIDVEGMAGQMADWQSLLDGLKIKPPQDQGPAGQDRSAFMDIYSAGCRWHMERHGTTHEQLAFIASKNHFNGSLNPNAQYRKQMSPEEILAARPVSWPLTVPMCAPVGDGGAAAVVCSAQFLTKVKIARPVKILASVLASGSDRAMDDEANDIACRASKQAYEMAALGPADIDVAEVHDATSFGELHQCEALGFCEPGRGGEFAMLGATRLDGSIPVNPSGGLESRGHPIGASGLGQVYELVTQLRHEAGKRQVQGCRIAMAENGGGNLGFEEAAMAIHILQKAH